MALLLSYLHPHLHRYIARADSCNPLNHVTESGAIFSFLMDLSVAEVPSISRQLNF